MTTEHWKKLEALFDAAIALPAEQRCEFVRQTASADEELAREALDLLAAHETAHPLLDAPSPSALPEGMRIGPYSIETLIGCGGMGVVYLASRADGQFDKKVAIKLLTAGLPDTFDDRHASVERQALARLNHPNICRLLDSGLNAYGQPYLVMDYVEGRPLNSWCKQDNPSHATALPVWLKIASAVAEAHRNLIVHRDLKPANILIDALGEPHLLDFGVAKLLDNGQAVATRTQYYTANYASPEQKSGGAITTSSDIYSLGVLLHELLTGALPHQIRRSLPLDLEAVLNMALREDPARRYSTVDQFADDVQRFLNGMPVTARADSVSYRVGKFLGRHKLSATLAAVAIAAIVFTTTAAVRQARRAEQVTAYLAGMLGGSATDPDSLVRELGGAVTLVQLIEQLDRKLTANPPAPEVEFELRQVIALDYSQMALYPQAQRNLARSMELARRLRVSGDKRYNLDLLHGAFQLGEGRFAEAASMLRTLRQQWTGIPSSAAIILSTNLGTAELRLGQHQRAEEAFDRGMRVADSNPGLDHTLLLSNSSLLYIEQGRFGEAIARLEKAATLARAAHKEPRIPLAWILVNLALLYRWTGQDPAAWRSASESLSVFERTLGKDHPATIHALSVMAGTLAPSDAPAAEALIRRGVAAQKASLSPGHYEHAVGLTHLGFVLMHRNKLSEAKQVLTEALAIRRKAFQEPNWRIAETEGFLGETLARMGNFTAAAALLRKSADCFEKVYGKDNARSREARSRLERWTLPAH